MTLKTSLHKGKENCSEDCECNLSHKENHYCKCHKEFKTSSEIYHKLFDMNGKEFVKAKRKLWLSKEEYEKKVEEFKIKIFIAIDTRLKLLDEHKQTGIALSNLKELRNIINDLINKIFYEK